jgi:hypothetical protein
MTVIGKKSRKTAFALLMFVLSSPAWADVKVHDAVAISYASNLRIVQNTDQIAIIVVQAPGALGNISTAHDVPERSKFKVEETQLRLPLHLYLAIRKDAPKQRVVDAAASLGGL